MVINVYFRSVIGQLINIPKHDYQSNNMCVVAFALIFSFHRTILIFYILIVTRLFNNLFIFSNDLFLQLNWRTSIKNIH